MPAGDAPTAPEPPTAPEAPSTRLAALDAFRGLTVLAMVLVNNPGDWQHIYSPLQHAPWDGCTPADLVFPFFLFIVGASMAYALRKYRADPLLRPAAHLRIARRAGLLILLGLLLNSAGQWLRLPSAGWEALDLAAVRAPGVLQRIALAYGLAALVALHLSLRAQTALAGAVLLGYWGLLTLLPAWGDPAANLSPTGNLVKRIDESLLGKRRLFTQATVEPTDPEGLLSTLPAVVSVLAGFWAGLSVQRHGPTPASCRGLFAAGCLAAILGAAWGLALPLNKKLWTSSYVILTSGLAACFLAVLLRLIDVGRRPPWSRCLEIAGVNAIFIFVASGLVGRWLVLARVPRSGGDPVALKAWLYERGFACWLAPPELASLAYALATVAVWWLVLAAMARRGWTLHV